MQKFPLRTLVICSIMIVAPTLASAATPSSSPLNARAQQRLADRATPKAVGRKPAIRLASMNSPNASLDLSSLSNLRERILSQFSSRTSAPNLLPSSSSISSTRSVVSSSSSSRSNSISSSSRNSFVSSSTSSVRSSSTPSSTGNATLGKQVFDLVNVERSKAGLPALTVNVLLQNSAVGHAQDMRTNNYFDHTGLNGSTPTQRIKAAGYPDTSCPCRYYYGENIARGQTTAEQVVRDWMNSEGHRKNILSQNFREIGIGISGTYWVQNFGGVWQN